MQDALCNLAENAMSTQTESPDGKPVEIVDGLEMKSLS